MEEVLNDRNEGSVLAIVDGAATLLVAADDEANVLVAVAVETRRTDCLLQRAVHMVADAEVEGVSLSMAGVALCGVNAGGVLYLMCVIQQFLRARACASSTVLQQHGKVKKTHLLSMDKLSIAEDVADNDTNGAVTLPPLETDDRKIVRKIERNPWNRLRSIKEDAVWVREVSDSLGGAAIPVVPNLRCGAWYITPDVARRSQDTTFCYFKSTDGHADQWSCEYAYARGDQNRR